MPQHQFALGAWHLDVWTLLGRLPLALCVVLLLAGGHKRQWPWRANVLATAAFAAGLSLGAWLLPSVLGALAGGLLLWFLAQRLLALHDPPLTALAIGITALIAIGRVGCLLTGCCFGRPTDLPWGVHYGPGSFALTLHRALRDVAPDALQSLAVHPYPLYESLGLAVWLLLLLAFARRFRAQSAVLAATAAFDLALRFAIDGHRAMLNVWWAATGSWLGIDRFRWLLAFAALLCSALAWRLEVHARTRRAPLPVPVRAVSPQVAWALYLGVWLVAFLTRFGATPLLHWTLLAALAVGALALPLPAWLAERNLRWLGPVTALLLLVPLVLPRAVQADAGGPVPLAADASRTWLYEPVPRQKALVRVGSNQDARDVIQQRERGLGIDPTDEPERTQQVWLGGTGVGGLSNYTETSSDYCGGPSSVINHAVKAGGGAATVDWQIPVLESSTVHIGARGGFLQESDQTHTTTTTVASGTTPSQTTQAEALRSYTVTSLTAWAEIEDEYVAFGLGGLVAQQSDGITPSQIVMPGGHLRLGVPLFSLDAGVNDRLALSPYFSARLGLTSAGAPGGVPLRVFIGGQTFPSPQFNLFSGEPPGFGASIEVKPTAWLELAAQFATGGESTFGGLAVRVAPLALAGHK